MPDAGPLWDIWLLAGYAPGRYAICLRAHHSTQDGMGLIGTLTALFGTASPPTTHPAPRAGAGAYLSTMRGMLTASAANNAWNDTGLPLTGHRDIDWADVPTQRLRQAAITRGGDTNDGFLAALSGALRTWAAQSWPRGADRPLPAIKMVNLRRAEEHDRPGNFFTFAPAPLPCHEPTAEGRLDHVIAATRTTKDPARHKAMRSVMDVVPARAFHALATRLTTPDRATISTSYLAIHRPLRYRQDLVTRLQPFTWLPRHQPASIVACSYNGTTSICFVTDAALPGLNELALLFQDAVSELPRSDADPHAGNRPKQARPADVARPAPDAARDTAVVIDFDFIKGVLVQQGNLPAESITRQATQEEAGIDSLAVTELSMILEERLGVVITEDELAKPTTMDELVSLVAQQAAASPDRVSPQERSPRPRKDRSHAGPEA
ncbi:wax ester/triacylglycerol synthase domain-containing protein [Streptomyces sp. NPDC048392]|uniref:wax ester/triacylglycerol synthase domain-containing protein n=1 Tax=Streptomyces sp. NPDC048392 TaxID=3365543 RepID=UPI003721A6AE